MPCAARVTHARLLRRSLTVGAALALVLVGACSDDEDPAASATTEAVETTTTAPADDTTTTTAAEVPAGDLVLRGDGLGVTTLGAAPDEAIAAVSGVLGPPTRDTGWEPSFSSYGTCPGEQLRGVEWDHLVLLFTDGETEHGAGQHLFAWRVTGAPPAVGTANGFGFGATAADAEELYPGAVEHFPPEEPFPGLLEITVDGGRISAYLDEADTVTNLEAGAPCGE